MEDKNTNNDFPDFGPDDDTEDMTGVSVFDPYLENKEDNTNINNFSELSTELDERSKDTN